jgi:hypothetical protein
MFLFQPYKRNPFIYEEIGEIPRTRGILLHPDSLLLVGKEVIWRKRG